jgi:hypothetical protein
MTKDEQIVIDALKAKRSALQQELAEIERVIKAKTASVTSGTTQTHTTTITTTKGNYFNKKKEILAIFDRLKRPLKMAEIREELEKTGDAYAVRDKIRTMHRSGILKQMKINDSNQLAYYVKPEWIDNETNLLKEKFDGGFNLMYADEDIKFFNATR